VPLLAAAGLTVDVPRGWDARIYRRAAEVGATTHTVLHAANFPLPVERGDFGSGAVDVMLADDVFVAIVEYHPEAARTPLFQEEGLPVPVSADWFSPTGLQRPLPGQGGAQRFFSVHGRAFSLYMVLGSFAVRGRLVAKVNKLLAAVDVDALGVPDFRTPGPPDRRFP
jgi:hypothetical protein